MADNKYIDQNAPVIYDPMDFNYNPFMDNHGDVKALFPNVGFFTFLLQPSAGDVIEVGGVPFTFSTSGADVQATGSFGFTTTPVDGDTITVNGVVFTFKDTPVGGNDIQTNVSKDVAAASAVTKLNASVDPAVSPATYSYVSPTLTVSYDTAGPQGNAFTLATNSTHLTVSGPTLTGGQLGNVSILIGGDKDATAANAVTKLNASTDASVSRVTYSYDLVSHVLSLSLDKPSGAIFTMRSSHPAAVKASAPSIGNAGVLQWFIR